MGRFRRTRASKRHGNRPGLSACLKRRQRVDRRRLWTRQQQAQWVALHGMCPERAGRTRLAQLVNRMMGHDRGARESALAELELATQLIRAGFRVELLPESQAKTADLECELGERRMFVEVTALVGSMRRRGTSVHTRGRTSDGRDDDGSHPVLVSRLLARVAQKARQLDHYVEPVLLAATVPHRDPLETPGYHHLDQGLDLKRLAGDITVVLARLRHLSAVLLSLWDVEPLAARSGVRLANVQVVERSHHQVAYPRVRMLILNPAAQFPLSGPQVNTLKGVL